MVEGFFQSIDHDHFYVNKEEVNLKLLFKVSSGLDRENTSICFLTEHVFEPLGGMTTFKECESPESFLLFVIELLQGQVNVERTGVQECMAICHKLHSAISPSILHRFSRSQWLRKALKKTFRSVPVTSRGDQ